MKHGWPDDAPRGMSPGGLWCGISFWRLRVAEHKAMGGWERQAMWQCVLEALVPGDRNARPRDGFP